LKERIFMKKFIAFFIDMLFSFAGFGYVIAVLTDQTVEGGFSLKGISMLFLALLMVAYFVVSKKFFGQSLGRKIMKISL